MQLAGDLLSFFLITKLKKIPIRWENCVMKSGDQIPTYVSSALVSYTKLNSSYGKYTQATATECGLNYRRRKSWETNLPRRLVGLSRNRLEMEIVGRNRRKEITNLLSLGRKSCR